MIVERMADRFKADKDNCNDVKLKNDLIFAIRGFDGLHEIKQILHSWNTYKMSESEALSKMYKILHEVEEDLI